MKLLLLLGDQLCLKHPVLQHLNPATDHILMAELPDEASYVPHNKLKIALVFSAMRHFAAALMQQGFSVHYYQYTDTKDRWQSFDALLQYQLSCFAYQALYLVEPGEHRLQSQFNQWADSLPVPVRQFDSHHFIFSRQQMLDWFAGKQQPRMEHFYQWARRQTGLLMSGSNPEGGKFNFDKHNRRAWPANLTPPKAQRFDTDDITTKVLALVEKEFAQNPGRLEHFHFAVTACQAEQALDDFIQTRLANFGDYQDALADDEPGVFHSLLSAYINLGLLAPITVCRRAEAAYYQGQAPINAVEGFIRQVLGWREYVRGLYWHCGEDYANNNHFNATHPLPKWFWQGTVRMRCVQQAVGNSLHLAYAHHIQRLMVIGNFALLAGLDVKQVCQWYLAVYIDAFEWVELPNTLGMALYADGGLLASKPYAASGNYLNKMGSHCQHCPYSPKLLTGNKACPYNSLYWRFIDIHQQEFAANPRMALMVSQWHKKSHEQRSAIRHWADGLIRRIDSL
ncbi:cryptochrome/photolyase family protein [Bowmanella denitrificans]|uniref:cryptochrome/photolyase family protein n=1 Tax=Bowmanella denitrificans TaxID=366582 RepID=UPI000C9BF250|nr:cryptochrome/photolyase family protein [Bowmanella denitrificans]